jgi:hypothetical protein
MKNERSNRPSRSSYVVVEHNVVAARSLHHKESLRRREHGLLDGLAISTSNKEKKQKQQRQQQQQ